jgi:ribose 1,5-bisphosphokinase PhnN
MTDAIYLVGAMGTGKSTVMAAIMDQLGLDTGEWYKVWPSATRSEFRGEHLEDVVTGEYRGLYLGRTRPEFPGTDAIGLASHAEALNWVRIAPELPPLVLGEGARLGTASFLGALAERCSRFVVAHLVAPEGVLDDRLAQRRAGQERESGKSESFRKSTVTRARNAVAGLPHIEIDTSEKDPQESSRLVLASLEVSG